MKRFKQLAVTAILASLTACGSGDSNDDLYDPNYGPYGLNGNCTIPAGGAELRTVVGNFGDGARLTLRLFSAGAGDEAHGYGELSIPSVQQFYGPDYGGMLSNPYWGYGQNTNGGTGSGAFRTCVSTNQNAGIVREYGPYLDIEMVLVGNQTQIVLGSGLGAYPTTISNNELRGPAQVSIGNTPPILKLMN
jgi:hypothetical protein